MCICFDFLLFVPVNSCHNLFSQQKKMSYFSSVGRCSLIESDWINYCIRFCFFLFYTDICFIPSRAHMGERGSIRLKLDRRQPAFLEIIEVIHYQSVALSL